MVVAMRIDEVFENRKRFLDLLLLGDEQEDMVDRYVGRGRMFVLFGGDGADAEAVAQCIAVPLGGDPAPGADSAIEGAWELKNIAVSPDCQGRGLGRLLVEHLFSVEPSMSALYAGTGDSPLTVPFYLACGFSESHRLPGFFLDNYDHPIFEGGVQLADMVYFVRMRS